MTTEQRILELAREIWDQEADEYGLPNTRARILAGEIDDCARVQVEIKTLKQGVVLGLEMAATAVRDCMSAQEWPPTDGDRQVDEVIDAIRALRDTK